MFSELFFRLYFFWHTFLHRGYINDIISYLDRIRIYILLWFLFNMQLVLSTIQIFIYIMCLLSSNYQVLEGLLSSFNDYCSNDDSGTILGIDVDNFISKKQLIDSLVLEPTTVLLNLDNLENNYPPDDIDVYDKSSDDTFFDGSGDLIGLSEDGVVTIYWDYWENPYTYDDDFFDENTNTIPLFNNMEVFEQNNTLTYEVVKFGDVTMYVGAENSLFSMDFIQNIRDLAFEETVETDPLGNTLTTIKIDTNVARELMDTFTPSSPSGHTLFSGLTEARLAEEKQYEQDIRNIRNSSVLFSSESSHLVSPLTLDSTLSITNVNSITSEEFRQELDQLELTRIDYHDRMQLAYSHQNTERAPLPMWSEVETRPTSQWDIEQWERTNAQRSAWATRLNGGYEHMNITVTPHHVAGAIHNPEDLSPGFGSSGTAQYGNGTPRVDTIDKSTNVTIDNSINVTINKSIYVSPDVVGPIHNSGDLSINITPHVGGTYYNIGNKMINIITDVAETIHNPEDLSPGVDSSDNVQCRNGTPRVDTIDKSTNVTINNSTNVTTNNSIHVTPDVVGPIHNSKNLSININSHEDVRYYNIGNKMTNIIHDVAETIHNPEDLSPGVGSSDTAQYGKETPRVDIIDKSTNVTIDNSTNVSPDVVEPIHNPEDLSPGMGSSGTRPYNIDPSGTNPPYNPVNISDNILSESTAQTFPYDIYEEESLYINKLFEYDIYEEKSLCLDKLF